MFFVFFDQMNLYCCEVIPSEIEMNVEYVVESEMDLFIDRMVEIISLEQIRTPFMLEDMAIFEAMSRDEVNSLYLAVASDEGILCLITRCRVAETDRHVCVDCAKSKTIVSFSNTVRVFDLDLFHQILLDKAMYCKCCGYSMTTMSDMLTEINN